MKDGNHGYGIHGHEEIKIEIREPDGSLRSYTWKKPLKSRSCDYQIKGTYLYRQRAPRQTYRVTEPIAADHPDLDFPEVDFSGPEWGFDDLPGFDA